MPSATWFSEIEENVFSYLDYRLVEQEDALFPSLFCTTTRKNYLSEDEDKVTGKFPTLFLHAEGKEQRTDLELLDVNSVNSYIYINVYSLTRNECLAVANQAAKVMHELMYITSDMPTCTEYKNIYIASFVARRQVDKHDADLIEQ